MLVVVAAVVESGGRVMLCQRLPEAHNGLKWEFPGGKLEPGETPEAALARELEEELASPWLWAACATQCIIAIPTGTCWSYSTAAPSSQGSPRRWSATPSPGRSRRS